MRLYALHGHLGTLTDEGSTTIVPPAATAGRREHTEMAHVLFSASAEKWHRSFSLIDIKYVDFKGHFWIQGKEDIEMAARP